MEREKQDALKWNGAEQDEKKWDGTEHDGKKRDQNCAYP